MNNLKILIVFVVLTLSSNLFSEVLKDATLRDEDISGLEFTVEYFKRADGLFEYVYKIKSPLTNIGDINALEIDLLCSIQFEPVTLPYSKDTERYLGGVTFVEAKYTPTAVLGEGNTLRTFGVTDRYLASWGIGIYPGEEMSEFRLVSATEPGLRSYKIIPWVDYDETWAFPDDYNLVPDGEDFSVIGLIAAPGCPGVTEPPTETYLYPGDSHRKQSETINNLLTYATPQRSRFHVDKGTKETSIHIYYSDDIDERTFKVQPGWMQRYFNPIAGSNEEVFIPLRKKRTKISLSVHTKKGTENGKTRPKRKAFESDFSYKDLDEFEIRVD